jgi:hypothetical protein
MITIDRNTNINDSACKASNADTAWMAGSVGISTHWTSHTANADGTRPSYEEAVGNFDVRAYADTLVAIGAKHCIFTLTHAEQYLPFPLVALDRILPDRTARRDLVGDLIAALSSRSIRFVAYYNHSCNGIGDPLWKKACGYADGAAGGSLDRFADNICSIVSAISERYGDGISAWWFDSAYSVDPRGPHNTISCEMGDWRFPWRSLTGAARSGNRRAAVAINAGVGSRFVYCDDFDYYAGEAVRLDEPFSPEAFPGKQDHRWICLEDPDWVFTPGKAKRGFIPPRFTEGQIAAYVHEHTASGRMVTFNILIDAAGRINPCCRHRL